MLGKGGSLRDKEWLNDLFTVSRNIIDVDWMVDFAEAVRAFNGKASACGNFDPVKVLLQGSVEDVKESVKSCLAVAGETTFIAAGCEVPKLTPYEKLKAVEHP